MADLCNFIVIHISECNNYCMEKDINMCSKIPLPDTTNLCFKHVGQEAFNSDGMPGFCAGAGNQGDDFRVQFCGKMSSGGEWGNPQTTNLAGCFYSSCNGYQDIGFGCCDNGPGIGNFCCGLPLGGGLQCTRESFTGDPTSCCLKDLNCNRGGPANSPPACYSDTAKQHACSDGSGGKPDYRNLVSLDCQDVLSQYCTGTLPTDNPNSIEWLDRWTAGGQGPCLEALIRNVFRDVNCAPIPAIVPGICGLPPAFPFDPEGYFWGQRLMDDAIVRYTSQGFALGTLPGFPGYNPWQDFIYNNVCCPYPGLCQSGLADACATQTAQRISLNPAVAQWCGCHLPGGEYERYSTEFNIPAQCTPMCNRAGTIPIVGINAEAVPCKQNICLIDGVTVNIVSSQIGGGINFNQICANCPNAQCSCIVSNTTVDIGNSTIGNNVVPIGQGCGSISCTQTNPGLTGPNTIPVSCGTGSFNPYTQYDAQTKAAQQQAKKTSWLWTMLTVGIALVLIFFIIFLIHPNFFYEPRTVIVRTAPIPRTVTTSSRTVSTNPSTANSRTILNPNLTSNSILSPKPIPTSNSIVNPTIREITGYQPKPMTDFNSIET